MSRASDQEKISRTVHVGGIRGLDNGEITERDVAEFFSQQGPVVAVRVHARSAWVEFADDASTMAALNLDGVTTGGHNLRVNRSKTAINTNALLERTREASIAAARAVTGVAPVAPGHPGTREAAAYAAYYAQQQQQQQQQQSVLVQGAPYVPEQAPAPAGYLQTGPQMGYAQQTGYGYGYAHGYGYAAPGTGTGMPGTGMTPGTGMAPGYYGYPPGVAPTGGGAQKVTYNVLPPPPPPPPPPR